MRALSPSSIHAPLARYSHGISIPAAHRLEIVAGQVGIGRDELVPSGSEAQADICFANIAAILAEDGMTMANVVRLSVYVTAREHMEGYRRSRDRHSREHLRRPHSSWWPDWYGPSSLSRSRPWRRRREANEMRCRRQPGLFVGSSPESWTRSVSTAGTIFVSCRPVGMARENRHRPAVGAASPMPDRSAACLPQRHIPATICNAPVIEAR